jgi:hypothetical protein
LLRGYGGYRRGAKSYDDEKAWSSINHSILSAHHPSSYSHKQRHTLKRQAFQHGCVPSLLGDGDKGMEIVYNEAKNLYWAD